MTHCECCGHPTQEHMDEAGEPAPCWLCIADKAWIREEAWNAGEVRRFFHRLFKRHRWYKSRCMSCGVLND